MPGRPRFVAILSRPLSADTHVDNFHDILVPRHLDTLMLDGQWLIDVEVALFSNRIAQVPEFVSNCLDQIFFRIAWIMIRCRFELLTEITCFLGIPKKVCNEIARK